MFVIRLFIVKPVIRLERPPIALSYSANRFILHEVVSAQWNPQHIHHQNRIHKSKVPALKTGFACHDLKEQSNVYPEQPVLSYNGVMAWQINVLLY